LRELDGRTLAAAVAEIPCAIVNSGLRTWQARPAGADVPASGSAPEGQALSVADLLAACGIVPSKSGARRAIAEGGAYLNNVKVTDVDQVPHAADFLHGRYLILRRGKRTVGGIVRATD
jgi:tyrosyl-tRNA synthetase